MPKLIQLGSTMPANETPYAIFKDRMQMVNTIVQNYKRYQEKKWDAEWQQAAVMDMTQEQKTPQTEFLLNNTNPSEKDLDVEGVTQFADKAIGMLRQKEIMMGNLPQPEATTSTMPQISQNSTQNEPITKNTNNEPQKQLIPDEMEFNELLKFVSELPTGRVDWSNTLEVFNKRLEKGRALGDAATQVLNTILNQGKVDQRAELKQNVELASYLKDTMYPETEQQEETFDPEAFLQSNPDMEITGYNSSTGGYTFKRKEEAEQKPQIDVNKLVTTLEENGMKLSSANFNPTTGNLSYSFTAEKTLAGTTKASWEQNLAKAQQFVKATNGEYEITGMNVETGSVTIEKVKKEENEPDTGKTPTYNTAGKIKEDLIANVETKQDYNNEINRLKALNIDTSAFSYADVIKEKYNQAMQWVKYSFDMIGAGVEQDENYNYKQLYKDSWESARKYDKEYQKETGKKLLTAPGEETPINSNATNAFIHDAQASGYTLADYDIEQLKKAGVDIEKARKALGN